MRSAARLAIAAMAGLAALTTAGAAMAQAAVNAPDNRLTRDNRLEPSNQPSSPADRAFDPKAQVATSIPIVVQRPPATVVNAIPVTASATVPVITISGPTLQAIPGDRWVTVLYINNNSGAAVDSQIGCTFTNGGRTVQESRVVLPAAAAGTRFSAPVYGPRTDVFVDRVLCRVLTP
jgi:hypothetical protein